MSQVIELPIRGIEQLYQSGESIVLVSPTRVEIVAYSTLQPQGGRGVHDT